jgi:hypothetical protein
MASAVVKVWSNADMTSAPEPATQDSAGGNLNAEEYWYMSDESTTPSPNPQKAMALPTTSNQYHVVAQYTKANIACARVCGSPVKNSVVVVGMNSSSSANSSDDGNDVGWWAELFSLRPEPPQTLTALKATFGLNRIVGFQGGASINNVDKKSLATMLGRTSPGRLQGAELAFASTLDSLRSEEDDAVKDSLYENGPGDLELVLCCLSDSGVITTSAMPEALPVTNMTHSADVRGRSASPSKKSRTNDFVRAAFPSSSAQTQIFPENNEGNTLLDLAGMFSGKILSAESSAHQMEKKTEMRSTSPLKSLGPNDTIRDTGRQIETGGFTQFDMDVPVQPAYETVNTGNIGGIQVGIPGLTSNAILGQVGDDGDSSVRDATSMMENIETARIPCPNLCGAFFGGGNGSRLVVFHNGEVKKMWNWYQKTDMIRLSNIPGGQADAASASNAKMVMSKTSSEPSDKLESPNATLGPRSLKELKDMMALAKEVSSRTQR